MDYNSGVGYGYDQIHIISDVTDYDTPYVGMPKSIQDRGYEKAARTGLKLPPVKNMAPYDTPTAIASVRAMSGGTVPPPVVEQLAKSGFTSATFGEHEHSNDILCFLIIFLCVICVSQLVCLRRIGKVIKKLSKSQKSKNKKQERVDSGEYDGM